MSPYKAKSPKDLERGERLLEERKKIWNSRAKFKHETNLSDRNLENWENGLDISCDCLREIHNHGGDIIYILTGKRSLPETDARPLAQPKAVDISELKILKEKLQAQEQEIEELKKDKEDLRNDKAELRKLLDLTEAQLSRQGRNSS